MTKEVAKTTPDMVAQLITLRGLCVSLLYELSYIKYHGRVSAAFDPLMEETVQGLTHIHSGAWELAVIRAAMAWNTAVDDGESEAASIGYKELIRLLSRPKDLTVELY